MNPLVLAVIQQNGPEIVAFIKGLFAKSHPDAPQPTDDEVNAAWKIHVQLTLAKDDAFRAEGGG